MLLNVALEYVIRKVTGNQEGLELNGLHRVFVYADEVNFQVGSPVYEIIKLNVIKFEEKIILI